MQNDIGQAYFGTLVCSSKNRRGPKKKARLKSWKFAWQTKKNKTTSAIAPSKGDRALFTRFLVVILSRPDLHMEDTISTFKLAEFPSTPFSSDGSLLHCIAKSKLINILEGPLPHQQPQTPTVQPRSPDPFSTRLLIFYAIAAVESLGTPSWVRNKRDLASHFIEVVDAKTNVSTEVHVVFDRYQIPYSLKEVTRQFNDWLQTEQGYTMITVDVVIDKTTMKDPLNCNQNKEALAIILATQLIECKKDSQMMYVVNSKGDCMTSNTVLHGLDTTKRGETSTFI